MERGARQHGGGERSVGAAIGGQFNLHGQQLAVFVERGAMARARWMALGGCGQIFHAVVDHLDRMAALHGQQSRVRGKRGRIILLAAERAAGLGLHHAHFFVGQVEDLDQRLVHVVGALQRTPDGDAALGAPLRDDAVVLNVEMLLRAGAVLAFDNVRGAFPKRNRRCPFRAESS